MRPEVLLTLAFATTLPAAARAQANIRPIPWLPAVPAEARALAREEEFSYDPIAAARLTIAGKRLLIVAVPVHCGTDCVRSAYLVAAMPRQGSGTPTLLWRALAVNEDLNPEDGAIIDASTVGCLYTAGQELAYMQLFQSASTPTRPDQLPVQETGYFRIDQTLSLGSVTFVRPEDSTLVRTCRADMPRVIEALGRSD